MRGRLESIKMLGVNAKRESILGCWNSLQEQTALSDAEVS